MKNRVIPALQAVRNALLQHNVKRVFLDLLPKTINASTYVYFLVLNVLRMNVLIVLKDIS